MARNSLAVVRLLLFCLLVNFGVYAQNPPARACKRPSWNPSCGCWFVGLTIGSGYCSVQIIDPCETCGGGGADTLGFYGVCQAPTYCTAATKHQVTDFVATHPWAAKPSLPGELGKASLEMARVMVILQNKYSKGDLTNCELHAYHLLMADKANPTKPWVADLRDEGNAYTLTLVRHKLQAKPDKDGMYPLGDEETGIKWTLRLGDKGWSLESTAGDHESGSF